MSQGIATNTRVSIPERVWGGLERANLNRAQNPSHVSIPERVWGGLERKLNPNAARRDSVSIPERVWGGLEPQIAALVEEHNLGFNP